MEVFVKAHATIRDLLRAYPNNKDAFIVHLPEQATLAGLFKKLDLPAEQVPLVVINGASVFTEPILKHGDIIELFPYIAGG